MVAGGVVLWSAPVVAAATFSRKDAADEARRRAQEKLNEVTGSGGPSTGPAPASITAATTDCTGYPPGTCITFECLGSHTSCGAGAGGFDCFCDVDATGACVCRNDANCSDLATCNPGNGNGDCAPGYFCIPTSCCGIPKCAPPCGTLPDDAEEAVGAVGAIPVVSNLVPGVGSLSGL